MKVSTAHFSEWRFQKKLYDLILKFYNMNNVIMAGASSGSPRLDEGRDEDALTQVEGGMPPHCRDI